MLRRRAPFYHNVGEGYTAGVDKQLRSCALDTLGSWHQAHTFTCRYLTKFHKTKIYKYKKINYELKGIF